MCVHESTNMPSGNADCLSPSAERGIGDGSTYWFDDADPLQLHQTRFQNFVARMRVGWADVHLEIGAVPVMFRARPLASISPQARGECRMFLIAVQTQRSGRTQAAGGGQCSQRTRRGLRTQRRGPQPV
jgi:hypothetical protein